MPWCGEGVFWRRLGRGISFVSQIHSSIVNGHVEPRRDWRLFCERCARKAEEMARGKPSVSRIPDSRMYKNQKSGDSRSFLALASSLRRHSASYTRLDTFNKSGTHSGSTTHFHQPQFMSKATRIRTKDAPRPLHHLLLERIHILLRKPFLLQFTHKPSDIPHWHAYARKWPPIHV